ncbi:DUF4833 domain-containing protein [Neptunitalea chrysea]|uniref:DUF4833 domain-containing protein n=1 Tax=Neptunitalea chrysea TaxID=1647581 RepID=A0A9W6B744_9FLAO|nr:DUF4833 domain-containing protein [Neptunitalea chrysea]GLB53785.1 DUF4833 domain-containing protein [Neptunitalea chrysea]
MFTTTLHTNKLKALFTLFLLLVSSITIAQKGYPVPKKEAHHLFYIQHSNNHNTYVYNANITNGNIDAEDPVEAYRVVYTEGGIRKSLSAIQQRLAYGMVATYVSPNKFKMHLAASKKLTFHLTMVDGKAQVYATINNKKMYLTHIFIELKSTGIGAKAKHAIFYGNDYTTHQLVTEKVFVED